MERADEPKLFFESLFERVVNIRTLVAHPVILQLAWEKGFHNIFGKIVLWWTLILSSLSQLRNPIFGLVSKNMANSRQNKPTQEQDAPENNNYINPYCVHAPLIPLQSGLSRMSGRMVVARIKTGVTRGISGGIGGRLGNKGGGKGGRGG